MRPHKDSLFFQIAFEAFSTYFEFSNYKNSSLYTHGVVVGRTIGVWDM